MTIESGSQPAAGTTRPSLSTEINTATRSIHTKLNRLITARLPLALPPHSASPRLYAFGLLHFAHVYLTFESAWHDITHHAPTYNNPALSSLLEDPWVSVTTPPSSANTPSTSSSTATPSSPSDADNNEQQQPLDPALLAFLRTLLPAGLPRSKRLRRDLAALLGLRPVELDVRLATAGYPGERVAAYAAHIRRTTAARPHVLIAYAWVMYMAVFAGGRWIRGQLANGGREFWEGAGGDDVMDRAGDGDDDDYNSKDKGGGRKAAPGINFDALGDRGLAFFSFDGEMDGEDIKAAFKARLEDAEALLSPRQRAEVVAEAHAIFEWSVALVEELDELLDTPDDASAMPKPLAGHGPAAAPVSEKKAMMSEKGAAAPMPSGATVQPGNKGWVRQGGSIAGALVVLGGVSWWAAYLLGAALKEGWHEGWAGV